jgi:regulator of sigma E protease
MTYVILVAFHMLAHLFASRLLKVDIGTASFGFGPKILKIWRTKLMMRIPLIYCEEINFRQEKNDKPESMNAVGTEKSKFWRKTLVLASGPFANFFLAVTIFAFLSSAGTPIILPVIGDVTPGSAAEKAGLIKGDRIISIDDRDIASWNEMADIIRDSPGSTLNLKVERENHIFTVRAQPEVKTVNNVFGEPERRPLLGIMCACETEMVENPLWKLPLMGISRSVTLIKANFMIFLSVFKGPLPKSNIDINGPIFLSKSEDKDFNILKFIFIGIATASTAIVFLSLFPLPIYDGGLFIYLLIETARRKEISFSFKRTARIASIFLLLVVFLVPFLMDLTRLFY